MIQGKEKLFTRSLACLALGMMLSSRASAQIHYPVLPDNKWIVIAEEQFNQGHFTAAAQSAAAYLHTSRNTGLDEQEKARFIYALSALKMDKDNCVDEAVAFLSHSANPSYRQRTAYALAQYYFNYNMFAEAIPYYEMAGISNLTNKEVANAKFELAYCYFYNSQFDKAEPLLVAIKELGGKYYNAGNYYYGLLAYNQSNYTDALTSFERIKDDKAYSSIVPYYIAEIHYFTGKKQKALEDALQLIKGPERSYYHNELHLLAAQVLFEEKNYVEAIPFFEYYYKNTDKIKKEDLYEMAYSYYSTADWNNAIDKLQQLSNTEDSLGQTVNYLLGDCYLKINDRKSARSAFTICANMSFIPAMQETALITSAKLAYEMGHNDDAIMHINELLATYPASSYKDEAKTLLSDLLIKTSNYAEAYKALQEVQNKDIAYWRVMQKVAYGYAMLQIQNNNLPAADSLLALASQQPIDAAYDAATSFWMGDIAYKEQQYAASVIHSKDFIEKARNNDRVTQLSPSATIFNAYLNMGYAAMQLKDFSAAQSYFAQAQQYQSYDSLTAINSILREADAVFMQKNYNRAVMLYDKVIAANGDDADYASFQKAIILGLMGKNADKIALLQSMLSKVPPSRYAADARYEMALAYIDADKYPAAITALLPLTQAFDRPDMMPKAWMKTGFCYQQSGNSDKAIEAFKHVAVEYPSSEERPAALDALKSLYIETNQPGAYAKLLKDNNINTSDDYSLDSTYYSAAEAQFASGKWDKAKQSFAQYLQQYPNGLFSVKAHYYKAESHFRLKEYKEAVAEYDKVLNGQWNDFSENSALHAATITFQAKNYKAALNYYDKLRSSAMGANSLQQAYNGLMQCSFNTDRFAETVTFADTLLSMPGIDENTMTLGQFYKARALHATGKQEEALVIFKQLTGNKINVIATEARYRVAEVYLQQNNLKEAEEAANQTIQKAAGNDYWIIKSYILLADILTKEKDYFNARSTLQSIVKNARIPELKQEAAKKLDEVKALEKKKSKLSE